MRRALFVLGGLAAAAVLGSCGTQPGPTRKPPFSPRIERVSVSDTGAQATHESFGSSISANGRYVVYESFARNIVPGDTNNRRDVFVHDRDHGTTIRASVAGDGAEGNQDSYNASISGDGRYVSFVSAATNLVPGDINKHIDLFIKDLDTGAVNRIQLKADPAPADGAPAGEVARAGLVGPSAAPPVSNGPGVNGPTSLSADGRFIAYSTNAVQQVPGDTNDKADVFVFDQLTGTTTIVSQGYDGSEANEASGAPAISADGRYVAFSSTASNLTPDDTNAAFDVFVHDRTTNQTTLVSIATDGSQGNVGSAAAAISADGRFVAFSSRATNLAAGDTNANNDIFLRDRAANETTLVSLAADGSQVAGDSDNMAISADGRFVSFTSDADHVADDALFDLFDTLGTSDVYLRDRSTNETSRVSVVSGIEDWRGSLSGSASISADGRFVAFDSMVSYLVPSDTNGATDVFVYDREG